MAAGPRERVHRTRPTGQLARRLTCKDMPRLQFADDGSRWRWLAAYAHGQQPVAASVRLGAIDVGQDTCGVVDVVVLGGADGQLLAADYALELVRCALRVGRDQGGLDTPGVLSVRCGMSLACAGRSGSLWCACPR